MNRINIADAKAQFSRLLERVEQGETIVLCRRNVPIAEIRALRQPQKKQRPVGLDRGMQVPASFFDPLPDSLLNTFEGGDPEQP